MNDRCAWCEAELAVDRTRETLCPGCKADEDAMYAVPVVFTGDPRFSRRAMQERLGITGDEDR